jgi:hypothetical protein
MEFKAEHVEMKPLGGLQQRTVQSTASQSARQYIGYDYGDRILQVFHTRFHYIWSLVGLPLSQNLSIHPYLQARKPFFSTLLGSTLPEKRQSSACCILYSEFHLLLPTCPSCLTFAVTVAPVSGTAEGSLPFTTSITGNCNHEQQASSQPRRISSTSFRKQAIIIPADCQKAVCWRPHSCFGDTSTLPATCFLWLPRIPPCTEQCAKWWTFCLKRYSCIQQPRWHLMCDPLLGHSSNASIIGHSFQLLNDAGTPSSHRLRLNALSYQNNIITTRYTTRVQGST